MFQTKEERQKIEWMGFYSHFVQRLKERYGIDVTFQEYRELCTAERKILVKQTQNKQIIKVNIKGREVIAVKTRTKLVTVLTPEHYRRLKN